MRQTEANSCVYIQDASVGMTAEFIHRVTILGNDDNYAKQRQNCQKQNVDLTVLQEAIFDKNMSRVCWFLTSLSSYNFMIGETNGYCRLLGIQCAQS